MVRGLLGLAAEFFNRGLQHFDRLNNVLKAFIRFGMLLPRERCLADKVIKRTQGRKGDWINLRKPWCLIIFFGCSRLHNLWVLWLILAKKTVTQEQSRSS